MKQETITYLSTIKDDILKLSHYLYENPESSFGEYKAYSYIINLLKKYDFQITENYLNISTAFYAKFGEGHPKICYICEYDGDSLKGHLFGNNITAAISLAAAISLKNAVAKLGGSIIILGCPGELIKGSKLTMTKQGTFDDIDAALMAKPHVITAQNGTSNAVIPLKVKFKNDENCSDKDFFKYSVLDGCLFTFNSISMLVKGLCEDCSIDGIVIKNCASEFYEPKEAEVKFYIRAPKIDLALKIEKKIRDFIKASSSLMNLCCEVALYETPLIELIPNETLSRLLSHNLKESGIIEIDGPKNIYSGIGLGSVSHIIPCICPFVSIVKDSSIQFGTLDFAKATIAPHAEEVLFKTAQALALTGLDLLEKESLITEAKVELSKKLPT